MKLYSEGEQLKRIADAIEEILRLVKLDQEASKKRWDKEQESHDNNTSYKTYE